MSQTGRYYRKTAVKVLAVMCHLYQSMDGKRVTKVMNTGTMMITGIRYAALGQKQTEPFVDSLCIAVIAVAFDKEKTTR